MNQDYPVIVKTYNLTLWYIKKLNSLPKNHRYTLNTGSVTLVSLLSIICETKVTLPDGTLLGGLDEA